MSALDALMAMTCRRFSRHVASDTRPDGGVREHLSFWLHWVVCPFCRRYWHDLRAIGTLHRRGCAGHPSPALLVDVKRRLRDHLRRRYP